MLKTIPATYALKNKVLPLREENDAVVIALADTGNTALLNELQFIFNKKLLPKFSRKRIF